MEKESPVDRLAIKVDAMIKEVKELRDQHIKDKKLISELKKKISNKTIYEEIN